MKVFISYAHDDAQHRVRVLQLAQQLRRDGVDCIVDQFLNGSPHEGWPLWMDRQIEQSNFVLIVGSPAYLRRYEVREAENCGKGVIWEGAVIRGDLYEAAGMNSKFIPVLFDADIGTLPKRLRQYTIYQMFGDYQKLLRLLTMQPNILPEPLGPQVILPHESSSSLDSVLSSHRLALGARATKHDWWNHPIPLYVAAEKGQESDARNTLRGWLNNPAHQHCIILGDPGAGKSGLIWWMASILANLDKAVTLVVSASKLRHLNDVTLSDLSDVSEPRLEALLRAEVLAERQLYILLDGLDELIGAEAGGDQVALHLLANVFGCVPATSRVVAACRTPAFSLIGQEFQSNLPKKETNSRPVDPYDLAIARALGLHNQHPLILRIQRVSPGDAKGYLEKRDVPDQLVCAATTSKKLLPFISTPFSLRLLTLALPHLVTQESIFLDDLYRMYVLAALLRHDPALSANDLESTINCLQRVAQDPLSTIPEKCEKNGYGAGLILRAGDRYEFSHYSLLEYFFASALLHQITNYDSRTLSRLDLVSGYNINRMLLPMVLRAIEGRNSLSAGNVRVVAPSEYREFLRTTGWRAATGYGIHPSMACSDDGTPSATFSIAQPESEVIHHDSRHGDKVTCAVSWYDAAVFAMSSRVRLPRIEEIRVIDCQENFLFWCADWYDEEMAHVCVFNAMTREKHGANPDVRLPCTALAVIGAPL